MADLDRRAILIGDRWVSPTVTWVRHFSPRSMPVRRGIRLRAFAADSWQALIEQLGSMSAELIPGAGQGLIEQLTIARAAGITVPRTVISTDPIAATKLLGVERVIIKALHQHFVEAAPGQLSWIFPEIANAKSVRRAGRPRGIPVVVQEHIAHEAEIRCYYVHGQILTFMIGKANPAALWLESKSVTAEQIDPPPGVAAAVAALAAAMSVGYGALDFLIADGKPVFLELNWAGDWLWAETRSGGAPVTAAVTAMLRDLHLATIRNSFPEREQPPDERGHFDLIRFLSGGSHTSNS